MCWNIDDSRMKHLESIKCFLQSNQITNNSKHLPDDWLNTSDQLKQGLAELTQRFDQQKSENEDLRCQIQGLLDSLNQCKDTKRLLKFEHEEKINQIIREHEDTMSQIRAVHQQEKSILLDKLDRIKSSKTNYKNAEKIEKDFGSNSTAKEEIDRLNFIVEEKEYMNIDLKEQIINLRETLSRLQ